VEVFGDVGISGPVEISGAVEVFGSVTISDCVCISGPVEISGTVNVRLESSDLDIELNYDAFARQRVSSPYTLLDFTSVYGKDPLRIAEEITGTGTSTENPDSYIEMSVTSPGDSVIRQTKEYVPYQPGKSRLIYMTGVLVDSLASQVISRMGCYDGSMGYFVQFNNGTISIVERQNGIDSVTIRSSWDDRLDGTGSSGKTVDFTKAQIFSLDQEWLGVGRVRVGFILEGRFVLAKAFPHLNTLTAPYYRMAKLPLRYEISQNGSTGSMRMICGSVISEGGFNNTGLTFSDVSTNSFSVNAADLAVVSLSLRTDNTVFPYNRTTIKFKNFDIFNNSNQVASWRLIMNPTITGTPNFVNYNASVSSARVWRHNGTDTVTGGTVIASGFVSLKENEIFAQTTDELVNALPIAANISGTPDILTLSISKISNNVTIYTAITWTEIR
jgi:hypothetical protein